MKTIILAAVAVVAAASLLGARPKWTFPEVVNVVDDLRDRVAALEKEVKVLKAVQAPAPAAGAPDVAEAIRRGELVVGMTLKQAKLAMPRAVTRTTLSGEGWEVIEWGGMFDPGDPHSFYVSFTTRLEDGRITLVERREGPRIRAGRVIP